MHPVSCLRSLVGGMNATVKTAVLASKCLHSSHLPLDLTPSAHDLLTPLFIFTVTSHVTISVFLGNKAPLVLGVCAQYFSEVSQKDIFFGVACSQPFFDLA